MWLKWSLRQLPIWIFSESLWEIQRKLLCVRGEARGRFCSSQAASESAHVLRWAIVAMKLPLASWRRSQGWAIVWGSFYPMLCPSTPPFTGIRYALQHCLLLLLLSSHPGVASSVLSWHLCFGGQEPKVWKSSSCQTIRISKECDCKSWSKKTARPVRLTWVLRSSLLNHKLPRGTREKISCTLPF